MLAALASLLGDITASLGDPRIESIRRHDHRLDAKLGELSLVDGC